MLSPSPDLRTTKSRNLSLVVPSQPHAAPSPAGLPNEQPPQKEFLHGIGRHRLEKAHATIEDITWRYSVYFDKTPREARQVRQRFMLLAPRGMQVLAGYFNTLRRVHKLAWSLAYQDPGQPAIIQSPFLELALDLIGRHYRDGMLLGLFDALLKYWRTLDSNKRQTVAAFIADKIRHYWGSRICLRNISQHARFYTGEDGAVALAEMLSETQGALPEVWRLLELPDHAKGYEYFSEVAFAFLDLIVEEQRFDEGIPDIIAFLGSHQKEETIKRCLHRIVLVLENSGSSHLVKQLQVAALQLIGDPADMSYWRPWAEAASSDVADFEKVRLIVKRWIAERLVEYFYDTFMQEDAKKRFWLNYTDCLSGVRIYCSQKIYEEMSRDEQMGPYAPSHFGIIRGARGEEVALVLQVKDHLLIESVTERPAFFACQAVNRRLTGIDAGFIQLSDLHRLHEMEPLLHRQGDTVIKHKQEGKITDGGVRSSFLTWWIRHHLGI